VHGKFKLFLVLHYVRQPVQKKFPISPVFAKKVSKDTKKLVFFVSFQTKADKIGTVLGSGKKVTEK